MPTKAIIFLLMFCHYYGWCEYTTLYYCRLSIAIIKTEKKAEQNIRSGAVPHYVSYEITCSLPQHGERHCIYNVVCVHALCDTGKNKNYLE